MKRALAASTVLHLAAAAGLAFSLAPVREKRDTAVAIEEITIRAHGEGDSAAPKRERPPVSTPAPERADTPAVVAAPAVALAAAAPAPMLTVSREGGEQRLTVGEFERWVRSRNRAPAYPRASNQAREQGRVVIRVAVRSDGAADAAEIETGSGFERLDQAALEAVKGWTFPPYKAGEPALVLRFPFKFELYD